MRRPPSSLQPRLTSVLMARIFNGETLIWATSRNSSLSQSVSATASIDFLYAAPEKGALVRVGSAKNGIYVAVSAQVFAEPPPPQPPPTGTADERFLNNDKEQV